MAMGTRKKRERQQPLWMASQEIVETPASAFYDQLNKILDDHSFDWKAESVCRKFYKDSPHGRPSLAPGVYFRALLIGYFEGISSERGIAWRVADSLSLRRFLGFTLTEQTPDHSTVSRTRRLYSAEIHSARFRWVIRLLSGAGLIQGHTIAIDATTLEANAAMRNIVRRDNGQSYSEYLTGLARAEGIESPTREQLARLDRKRKKKASNEDWESPVDPDARIAKMKDGSTHLAHKAEHAVDLSSGALLAVTLQAASEGDTTTMRETLAEAQSAAREIHPLGVEEVVADKGYHSGEVLKDLHVGGVRSYLPEPDRGQRHWHGKELEQRRTYENRRRVRGGRGKRLQKIRSELTERTFAHMYGTGAMRRVHLRGRANILKRLAIHGVAFNLSLVLRKVLGAGTPRGFNNLGGRALAALWSALGSLKRPILVLGRGAHHFALQSEIRSGTGRRIYSEARTLLRMLGSIESRISATGC